MCVQISKIISLAPEEKIEYLINDQLFCKVNKIKNIDISKYTNKKGLRKLPHATKNALVASMECSRDMLCSDLEKVGIYVASSMSYIEHTKNFMNNTFNTSAKFVSPMAFPNTVLNSISGWISIVLGVSGPNITINTGRTSALDALKIATDHIKYGLIEQALVVATEEISKAIIQSDLTASDNYVEGTVALLVEKANEGKQLCMISQISTNFESQEKFEDKLSKIEFDGDRSKRIIYDSFNTIVSKMSHNQKLNCDIKLDKYGEGFSINSFLKIYDFINSKNTKAIVIENNQYGNKAFIKLHKR